MRLSDTHNGYRVIKKSVLPKLKLTFNGMEHASEILELIGQQGIKYIEVPNTILYTEAFHLKVHTHPVKRLVHRNCARPPYATSND